MKKEENIEFFDFFNQIYILAMIFILMVFKGVLISESLCDKNVLDEVRILKTKIEKVTLGHRTPWLSQWTINTIEIEDEDIDKVCEKIKDSFDKEHEWYVELKSNKYNIQIFSNEIIKRRIFKYFS